MNFPNNPHGSGPTDAMAPQVDTFEDSSDSEGPRLLPVRPHLFVALECDRPTSGGARYSLAEIDEVVIGRGAERCAIRKEVDGVNRLVVQVPGRSMSSTHARLVRSGTGWELQDNRSTNGSFVNGKRAERQLLEDGDVIELGHTLFAFKRALPTPADSATVHDSCHDASHAPELTTLVPSAYPPLTALIHIAESTIPVLLIGETGTGKEVLARSLHRISRRTGPFVAVNCGAVPANLVESQFFGHVKGAFSGAIRDVPGAVRSADKGTLLLDEIGDLAHAAQPALLRVLQEGEVTPVGGERAVQVDVRVIAATHQPLAALASRGLFRSDLLARLGGFTHHLPSLRERREDLGVLMASMQARGVLPPSGWSLSPAAGLELLCHDWPANVRELEQTLVRAVALTKSGQIGSAHLKMGTPRVPVSPVQRPARPRRPLSEADQKLRQELLTELERHGGRVADVARSFGKARMQIHRWMKKFGIELDTFRR